MWFSTHACSITSVVSVLSEQACLLYKVLCIWFVRYQAEKISDNIQC